MLKQFETSSIAVLMGGKSEEREISLISGRAIHTALERQGYQAITIDPANNLAKDLLETHPDAAVIALHGPYGEDGTVQGLLEIMEIPYSGCGVLASSLCMDKALTKKLVALMDIPVARAALITDIEDRTSAFEKEGLSYPLVVKPNRQGSTLGITLVREEEQLEAAVRIAFEYDKSVLLEEYIDGTEVTVGILNGKALPVLEVVPSNGFYDFEAKYTKGKTEYIVPARIEEVTARLIQQQSEQLFDKLNLSGVIRIDFIIDQNGSAIFLEINTIPGMTETSLVPKAAQHAGIDFDGVIEAILQSVSLKN